MRQWADFESSPQTDKKRWFKGIHSHVDDDRSSLAQALWGDVLRLVVKNIFFDTEKSSYQSWWDEYAYHLEGQVTFGPLQVTLTSKMKMEYDKENPNIRKCTPTETIITSELFRKWTLWYDEGGLSKFLSFPFFYQELLSTGEGGESWMLCRNWWENEYGETEWSSYEVYLELG
jgi:hypothetical protein